MSETVRAQGIGASGIGGADPLASSKESSVELPSSGSLALSRGPAASAAEASEPLASSGPAAPPLPSGSDEGAPAPEGPCAVEVSGWGWRHGGRLKRTLEDVDLAIRPGERILVLGPSGSGKSTLMAGLAGLLGGDDEGEAAGSLLVDGRRPEEQRGRIGLVMQDPEAQVVLARVGDDVAFGMENLGVPRDEIWPRVDASLDAVGLRVARHRSTSRLSGGQKQRLALASVLAMRPGLLLLDEPTANLDPAGAAGVRDAVERVLAVSGATLVVIEHRVDVWADLVDRVVVILDGRIVADGSVGEVLAARGEALRERGIWLPGDDVAAEVGGESSPVAGERAPGGPSLAASAPASSDSAQKPVAAPALDPASSNPSPILSARALAIGYSEDAPVRTGIDLDIPRGASTCLVGANGAGKTTLALTLAGLLPQLAGTIALRPASPAPSPSADPHDWRSADLLGRVSMVFQEPEYQFVARTVREELEIGPRRSGADGTELDALVDEYLDALGLKALAKANPMTLSGGEKRRLSVATALVSAPELLILDEPTFGQDRRTWIELVRLLRRARERGTTLVSITHDPAFVEAMGDHVVDLASVGTPVGRDAIDEGGSASPEEGASAGAGAGSGSASSPETPGRAERIPVADSDTPSAPERPKGAGAGDAGGKRGAKSAGRARGAAETGATPTVKPEVADRAPGAPKSSSAVTSPRRSILDRVNPVTRVLALILMTTPLIASIDVVSAGSALVLEAALLVLARISPKSLALRMAPLFIAAPLAAVSMLLYALPGGHVYWSFGVAVVSDRSIRLAAGILLRVLAIGAPAIVLLTRIDPTDMADGLAQVLGLPARPVLATLAAARMTGLMVADWKGLEQARRIRGIGDAHKVVSAARGSFSLLVFALRRSAKLSLTMEARGFGAPGPRTWARESRMGAADAVMLAYALLVPIVALAAAAWTGEFELIGR